MAIMTDSKAGLPQPGLDAAREGRDFMGYVIAKTGIGTAAALTDATFKRIVDPGKRLVVTAFTMYLSTVSDWVTAYFCGTANEDGSGAVTRLTPTFQIDTGAALAPVQPAVQHFDPPLVLTRDEAHAFSAVVQGNDATAALTLGYFGWEEEDTDLNS